MPWMRYNRQPMMPIPRDRVQIAKNVNATAIGLDEALQERHVAQAVREVASSACILSADPACDVGIQLGVRGATRYTRIRTRLFCTGRAKAA
jgi:hypothetical protein